MFVRSLYYDVSESLDESSEDDEISEVPKKMSSNGILVPSESGSWLDVDIISKESAFSSSAGKGSFVLASGRSGDGKRCKMRSFW